MIPELPRPVIPEMKDWDSWYKFAHEELIKHITRIDSHIRTLEIFLNKAVQMHDADGKLILKSEITSLSQIVSMNSYMELLLEFQNELRMQFETSETQISKLTDMLVPLEPFLPQLRKFAEEKKREDEEKAKWK